MPWTDRIPARSLGQSVHLGWFLGFACNMLMGFCVVIWHGDTPSPPDASFCRPLLRTALATQRGRWQPFTPMLQKRQTR